MHVYIGGASNGKRDYVRASVADRDIEWFEGELPQVTNPEATATIVVAGLEKWLADTDLSEEEAIIKVLECVKGRDSIFILTDVGRGIVPMDAERRQLRDACGRLYQRLIAEADEVTRVWYGLAQTLKKRG